MKKYLIRINCLAYEDIEVESETEEEAIEEARNLFNCSGSEGEYCETLKRE